MASADGMRFVIPVATIHAAYNPRYFGRQRGSTLYSWMGDTYTVFAQKLIPGTQRDSLYVLDGLIANQTGIRPEMVSTDTAGASEVIFALTWALGYRWAPRTPGCSWKPQLSSKPPGFRRQKTARPAVRTPHSLLGMDTSSGEDLVRAGYDALSHRYRGDDDSAEEYSPWLADLQTHLPDRGDVLDIGCGCGLPVARCLAAAGHRVTGVDISNVQIERARRLVPDATFIREDAAQLRFSPGSFDAIICLYALIHMPLDQQPRLLRSIADWLRPGGCLLATTGQDAWTGTQDNWLGGPATMWWSHADAATYRSWLQQAGLEVTVQQFVPEGDSGHALFWARRPPHPSSSSTEPKGQNHP